MTLHIKFTSKPFDKIETRCAAMTVYSDFRPLKGVSSLVDWRLNGRLSQVLKTNRFQGNFGECLLMPAERRIRAQTILVMGLGPRGVFNESHVGATTQLLLEKMAQKKIGDFLVSYSDFIADRFEWRNGVRLLVSKLHDFSEIGAVTLCEPDDCVRDAKRRHMDFGGNVDVAFEMMGS
ncbi:MAG: hypothetical protein HYU99_03480 [Deltaproteobacteria bacterium]|nr:hypothetical protein [Deltaproteobacteria bacterium]